MPSSSHQLGQVRATLHRTATEMSVPIAPDLAAPNLPPTTCILYHAGAGYGWQVKSSESCVCDATVLACGVLE